MSLLIGATGRAGAGKDTVCNMVAKELQRHGVEVQCIACATPLKVVCEKIFGIAFKTHWTAFQGTQEEKNAELPEIPGWTGRKILQHIGTEGFRHIDANVWATYMYQSAQALFKEGYEVVLVSDIRFLSEARVIQDNGGIILRINRPSCDTKVTQGLQGHASELELASIQADYVINNLDRSLKLLEGLVHDFLQELKLCPPQPPSSLR